MPSSSAPWLRRCKGLLQDARANRKKLKALGAELSASEIPVSERSSTIALVGASVPVDVLFDGLPGGLTFAALKSRKREVAVGTEVGAVAALADVIASKRAAGRPKDLAQLPILEDALKVLRALEAAKKK